MPIRIKVAKTARELDDVFNFRYRVFVEERGKFEGKGADNPRVVDHFDAVPGVTNVVAYQGSEVIASMRINPDSDIGLPAEHYFDFSDTRRELIDEYRSNTDPDIPDSPVIVGCSMLAVHENWRNRRNVIFSLFKAATGIIYSWGATHVICSISEETLSLYGRLGFKTIAEAEWNESVSDHMVPILAPFDRIFEWTFGQISKTVDHFWLDNFCGQFERILLSPGEVLFYQNDPAEHTYAIDEGWIAISREDPNGNEMVLANLSRGALFGELAVFDGERRSAKASALVNTELISIESSDMFEILKQNPENMAQLLKHFAKRMRDTDNLAMIQAFAPQTGRVEYALSQLWQSATPSKGNPDQRSIKVGPQQIARTARVREDEVRNVLELKKAEGILDYGENIIRFAFAPEDEKMAKLFGDSSI